LDRGCRQRPPPGEVVVSMRPVSVSASGPDTEIELLRAELRGRWRQALRAMMVLLSVQGLPAAQIAELLECHPGTVRRWIGRFSREGAAGLADRPRCGRPRLGGPRLARRIAGCWSAPGCGRCRGSGSIWAGRRSACGRCTGGCARWRSGGDRS
jgi:hypothetical protein